MSATSVRSKLLQLVRDFRAGSPQDAPSPGRSGLGSVGSGQKGGAAACPQLLILHRDRRGVLGHLAGLVSGLDVHSHISITEMYYHQRQSCISVSVPYHQPGPCTLDNITSLC